MKQAHLNEGRFLLPTPLGAFYCVANPKNTPTRQLLRSLINTDHSQELTPRHLTQWTSISHDDASKLLRRISKLGWIETSEVTQASPCGTLEDILPKILPRLSSTKKILLADTHGLSIFSTGFSSNTTERLSAISADLASLHERHRKLIESDLKLPNSAWSLVNGKGNSQIGFWPMYFRNDRLALIIEGNPYFNQPAFTQLIWSLHKRYGH